MPKRLVGAAFAFGFAASLLVAPGPVLAGKADDTLVWTTGNEVDTADLWYQNLREVVIMAHLACDTLIHHDDGRGNAGIDIGGRSP